MVCCIAFALGFAGIAKGKESAGSRVSYTYRHIYVGAYAVRTTITRFVLVCCIAFALGIAGVAKGQNASTCKYTYRVIYRRANTTTITSFILVCCVAFALRKAGIAKGQNIASSRKHTNRVV